MGNKYLRRLLIIGATSLMRCARNKPDSVHLFDGGKIVEELRIGLHGDPVGQAVESVAQAIPNRCHHRGVI